MQLRAKEPEDWQEVLALVGRVAEAGGRAHLVGGSVRDALLGGEVSEFDLEVFGLQPSELEQCLSRHWELDRVGRSFSVIKIRHRPIDVALPRRERKVGEGHRGFEIEADPGMSFEEAAQRRDFTINAIAWDPLSDRLIDPTGGEKDLREGRLRHTSRRFSEDPLRVLRGMQFIARFDLTADPATVELCRSMGLEKLPQERLWQEWRKLLLQGVRIKAGLDFLHDTNWLRFFPEIEALVGCPQDEDWHPEGDVFVHTGFVMDAFAEERLGDEWEDLVVGLACLAHDFGKPATTEFEDGRWRARGHEAAGVAPTRTFLERLTDQDSLANQVTPLVAHHLKPRQLYQDGAGDSAIRRLARKVGRIDRLVRVARADARGRPPLEYDGAQEAQWLLSSAERLAVAESAPQPLIRGRDLIDLGLEPGPGFGPILDTCFEAQLEGAFSDREGGLIFLARQLEGDAPAS